MARNLKLFFDKDGSPRARGPASEKILMAFLETDVQGSDHLCHELMEDLTAVEDGMVDSREFIGNAHAVTISTEGVFIDGIAEADALDANDTQIDTQPSTPENVAAQADQNAEQTASTQAEAPTDVKPTAQYTTGLKHFREVLEDWEAFILDDQLPA